jgi:hypothetical protein
VIKFSRPRSLPYPQQARFQVLAAAAALTLAVAAISAAPTDRLSSAASPAPASAYGLIWLDVDPGPAEVALDGDFLDAGVWLISVSPGQHEVRVRKTGFRDYAGRVLVPPGGSVHLDVRLQPGAAGDS